MWGVQFSVFTYPYSWNFYAHAVTLDVYLYSVPLFEQWFWNGRVRLAKDHVAKFDSKGQISASKTLLGSADHEIYPAAVCGGIGSFCVCGG